MIADRPPSAPTTSRAGRRDRPAPPTITELHPIRRQRVARARRTTPAASAWRRRTPRPARARRAARAIPAGARQQLAPPRRAQFGRHASMRGSSGTVRKAERADQVLVVLDLMHVRRRRRTARVSSGRAPVGAVAPALGNAGPPRRQRRHETSSAAGAPCRSVSRARRRASLLVTDLGGRARRPRRSPGTSAKSGAIGGPRGDGDRDASGNARRTSAIAGSAMTASPSQLGAKTTSDSRWHGRCHRRPVVIHAERAAC